MRALQQSDACRQIQRCAFFFGGLGGGSGSAGALLPTLGRLGRCPGSLGSPAACPAATGSTKSRPLSARASFPELGFEPVNFPPIPLVGFGLLFAIALTFPRFGGFPPLRRRQRQPPRFEHVGLRRPPPLAPVPRYWPQAPPCQRRPRQVPAGFVHPVPSSSPGRAVIRPAMSRTADRRCRACRCALTSIVRSANCSGMSSGSIGSVFNK